MLDSALIVLPVFGLVGLGFVLRRIGLVGERAGDGLSDFVFNVAIPALIFRTLSQASLPPEPPWGYWAAYFGGVAIVWAIAMLMTRRLFARSGVEVVVAGFTAAQANTVLVGIPLILKVYGDAGAGPLFLLVAIHLPITMTVATLLVEGRNSDLGAILRRLAANPILLGILAGAAARLVGFEAAGPVRTMLDMLAGAAGPCALFAMGVALYRYGVRAGLPLTLTLSGLKLVLHPLIVLVLATQVFRIDPVFAGVAVVFAASPCGVNAYLFAERYREGVDLSASAVALSTGLAVISTTFWLAVLQAIPV